jgi:magnesium chelatase family protein
MEEGQVTVSRVGGTFTYPSAFMLLASMNPCPCGYYGLDKCRCSKNEVIRYLNKISGPLLDRIDIHIEAPPVEYDDITLNSANRQSSEPSAAIKERVVKAREIQSERYKGMATTTNSQLTSRMIPKFCPMDGEAEDMLRLAFGGLDMSARGYHRIIKVARTIADLDGEQVISVKHVAEAVSYRNLDRRFW